MNIIHQPTSAYVAKWQHFVFRHPMGNVFQTPYMYQVYLESANYHPLPALMIDNEGEIIGVLLVVLQTFASGVASSLSSRALILGGPLVKNNDPDLLAAILKEYDQVIQNRAIFTEVRNSFKSEVYDKAFIGAGFEYEDHFNILVDLTKSEENLWKAVQSKGRNKIRRAHKMGTTFDEAKNNDDLNVAYDILVEVYERAELPFPDISFFQAAFSLSEDNSGLRIFTAINDGKIIGARFVLYSRDILYDYYAGAYREHYNKYPNDLLPWEIFLWGKDNGYKFFDFGGAGKPGIPYGVRDYKMKFGGELLNFGRYRKVHQPLKMKLAKTGFKAWKLIRNFRL